MAKINLTQEEGKLVLEHMALIMGDEHRVLGPSLGQEAERLYNRVQAEEHDESLPHLYVRILDEVVKPQ